MSTDQDDLLASDVLGGIRSLPIGEVRDLRARCIDVETGLSYLRRMVQAPLDLVTREQQRRRDGGGPSEIRELIDSLPEVLSANTRVGGPGRLPTQIGPGEIDPALSDELASIVGSGQLAAIATTDDADLAELASQLEAFERRVSERRRAFHARIDALQAELARRYRTGEATVESLLH